MRVAKWGNSLAVRLPAAVVEALELKEGDEIEIGVAGSHTLTVEHDESRKRLIERLKTLSITLPPGFKFDREEANER